MLYGALEAGGTKMVLAVSDERLNMLDRLTLPTKTPSETMPAMIDFFRERRVDALGVGTFGPVNLHADSPDYGTITATPKLAWRGYPLLRAFREALHIPCAIDTDVNAAALGEVTLGAGRGVKNCVYVTVGTGIGGGVYSEGSLVHGLLHPEVGHFYVSPHPDDPMPQGMCPYHGACLEGMASGPAIEKRWGVTARELPADHTAWRLEAYYLAQMCQTLLTIVSPEKIILGGGVMGQKQLFPMVRAETKRLLNGYLSGLEDFDALIVPPDCYPDSGLMGALLLAQGAAGQ